MRGIGDTGAHASPRLLLALALALFGATAFGIALLNGGKGFWYDEYFSFYLSSPDVPLTRIVTGRWLPDIHPPTYPAILWLMRGLMDPVAPAHRIVNLLAFVAAGAALLWQARAHPSLRPFLFAYALILCVTPAVLTQALELRAASLVIAADSVVVGFYYLWLTAPGVRPRAGGWLVFGVAVFLALNLHYIGTFISATMQAALIAMLWWRGQRAIAWRAALIVGVAMVPVASWFLLQRATVAYVAGTLYAQTSTLSALKQFTLLALGLAVANLVATALAARAVVLAWRQTTPLGGKGPFLFAVTAGLALLALVLLAINFVRPFIVSRYIIAVVPFGAALIAALAAEALTSRRATAIAATVVGLVALPLQLWRTPTEPDWRGTGRIVAALVARCPTSAIHVLPYWEAQSDGVAGVPNGVPIIESFYRHAAREQGFAFEPRGSRRVSSDCPTAIWVEHVVGQLASPAVVARQAGLALPLQTVARGRLFTAGRGVVLVFAPADQ